MKRQLIFNFFICLFACYMRAQTTDVFTVTKDQGEFLNMDLYENGSSAMVVENKKYKGKVLTIPQTVTHNGKTYKVKGIQAFAFSDPFKKRLKIEEIIIPEGIEEVGQNCFSGLSTLKKVTLPKSLKNLSYCMFEDCGALQEVIIPYNAQLRKIEKFVFKDCVSLSYFHIPEKVDSITVGGAPWRNCGSLTQINVALANSRFNSVNGVLYSKDMRTLIQYPAGKKDEAFLVPEKVDTVGNSAYWGNPYLKRVKLPEGLKYISHIAFRECKSLAQVNFPNSLKFIGNAAFQGCEHLKSVILNRATTFTANADISDSYNTFMPSVFIDRVEKIPALAFGFEEKSDAVEVDNCVAQPMDLSAIRYKRLDANGQPCVLVVVQLPYLGCVFTGNVVGKVEYHTNEYWVYLTEKTKYLKIQVPNSFTILVSFVKYGFDNGLNGLTTYYLSFR